MIDPVWELYRIAHRRTDGVSTLLEWDDKIPPFPVAHAEVLKAKQFMGQALAPTPTIAAPTARAAVPHPLSFLVPEVG